MDVRIPFEVLWNLQKNAYANLGSRLVRDWLWWLDLLPKPSDKPARSWDDVPEKIKETFERIGIPEAERAYLAGASAQYESEVVYHNMKEEFEKLGIIFTDTDSALKEYPDLFKQYFAKLVPPTDNKLGSPQLCSMVGVEPLSTCQKVSR